VSALRQWTGSILFTSYLFLSVLLYATVVLLVRPFSQVSRCYRIAVAWADSVLFMLERLCGLSYSVKGRENLPSDGAVALVRHSSAWEAIAQLKLFPPQTWVLKRELLWAPFLGWALLLFKPIAINRKGGRSAVEEVLQQGRKRLQEGLWVIIYPEGTRMAHGELGRFGLSGALLATATGHPVIPVAHNAGVFWPRRGWVKRRGTIRVMIGPPIATAGRDPRTVNTEARQWIAAALKELDELADR